MMSGELTVTRAADMKVLEILYSMHAVLVLPEHWTKHAPARNLYGIKVQPMDEDAVKFCLIGARVPAVIAVSTVHDHTALTNSTDWILNRATSDVSNRASLNYVSFNDAQRTTHADVVRLLEIAIAKQEALVAE